MREEARRELYSSSVKAECKSQASRYQSGLSLSKALGIAPKPEKSCKILNSSASGNLPSFSRRFKVRMARRFLRKIFFSRLLPRIWAASSDRICWKIFSLSSWEISTDGTSITTFSGTSIFSLSDSVAGTALLPVFLSIISMTESLSSVTNSKFSSKDWLNSLVYATILSKWVSVWDSEGEISFWITESSRDSTRVEFCDSNLGKSAEFSSATSEIISGWEFSKSISCSEEKFSKSLTESEIKASRSSKVLKRNCLANLL